MLLPDQPELEANGLARVLARTVAPSVVVSAPGVSSARDWTVAPERRRPRS